MNTEHTPKKTLLWWMTLTALIAVFVAVLLSLYSTRSDDAEWAAYSASHGCRLIYEAQPTAGTKINHATGERFPDIDPGQKLYQCDDGSLHKRHY